MKEPIRFGIVLFLFCAISAGLLAVVNGFTAPIIEAAELEATMNSYKIIFGDAADDFERYDEAEIAKIKEAYPDIQDIFTAKKSGEVVGYGMTVTANGFGGAMTNAIGIRTTDDKIAGFRNIVHQETKNFGSLIEEEDYYTSYNEKSATGELTISKEPQGDNEVLWLSGATVTSKAVVSGSNIALQVYNEFLKQSK